MKTLSDKKITVLISGGGTGGHIYPAIAVAQKLKNDPDIKKIYYIGCSFNMEKDIATKEDLDFLPIKVSGLPRKFSIKFIKWSFDLLLAIKDCIFYLKKTKPDVVLGTGGYVSGPVLIASHFLKIPFVVHDADAYPGIVNKFMAKYAQAVSVAFEESKLRINSKNIIVNGNPLRSNINQLTKTEALSLLNLSADKKTIIVIGGSQGARTLNNAIIEAASKLIFEHDFQIIHQTGNKNYENCVEKIKSTDEKLMSSSNYIVRPYFDNMPAILGAADLALSRAGSLMISELSLSGLPSILVPYPYAAQDHQRFNAKAMEQVRASVYLEDSECNSYNIIEIILKLFSSNNNKLEEMKRANNSMSKPFATDNIVKILKQASL